MNEGNQIWDGYGNADNDEQSDKDYWNEINPEGSLTEVFPPEENQLENQTTFCPKCEMNVYNTRIEHHRTWCNPNLEKSQNPENWEQIENQLNHWRDLDIEYWRQRKEKEYRAYFERKLQTNNRK